MHNLVYSESVLDSGRLQSFAMCLERQPSRFDAAVLAYIHPHAGLLTAGMQLRRGAM